MRASATRRLLPHLALLVGGSILAVLLIFLLVRSVDLSQLGTDFANADYLYLLIAFVPFLINLLIKVPRAALLYGDDAPGWDTLFGAINVGYGMNSLLPARLGEVARAYWVRDRAGISMVQSLSTIALERVTDGVAVLLLLLITAPTVTIPARVLGSALILGALFVIVLFGMAFLVYQSSGEKDRLAPLLGRLETGRFAFASGPARQVINGLQALRSRRAILLLIGYTIIVWSSNSLFAWLVVLAFHIHVPFTAAVLLIAGLNLGMSVPSTPGYVGAFEGLMVLILGLYGIHHTPALAAALVLHAMAFGPSTIIAVIYITRSGFQSTMHILRAGSGEAEPATEAIARSP